MSELPDVPEGFTRHFITVMVIAPSLMRREYVARLTQNLIDIGDTTLRDEESDLNPDAAPFRTIKEFRVEE